MLGIFFLFLGIVAAKMMIWHSGLPAIVFGATDQESDYAIAAISFAAAIIFFGLWRANCSDGEKLKSRSLFFD